MALFWRMVAALAAIAAFVIALFIGLTVLQFNRIQAQLESDRLAVLASRTAAPFASAVRIGLPIETVRNAETLLERARQLDLAISAIAVFGADGTQVFSTGSAPVPAPPSDAGSGTESWFGEASGSAYMGLPIRNASGALAGSIVLVYAEASRSVRSWAMAAQLAFGGALLVAVLVPLAAMLLRRILRREFALFDALEDDISKHERAVWRGTTNESGRAGQEQASDGDLASLLDATERVYRMRLGDLISARASRS